MADKLKINFDRKDYNKFFKFLINSKFNEEIKNWKDFGNGRVNRTFLFKDEYQWEKVIPKQYHTRIKLLLHKVNSYKTPFQTEKVDFLRRIQVIESCFVKKSDVNTKGLHIFNHHCDRINTYKIYVFFSDIEIKDGPIYFARINKCKNQVIDKLKEIEKKKKEPVRDFRSMKATIFCNEEQAMIGKFGDVLIFDGREPHRASFLKKNGYRAVVIFEFFTEKNWNLYSQTILDNN